ncbi:MAG: VanW family protein [Actinomycetia bacterium]|nr:VanW family protein [Actinomycetes bacterium]
MATPKTRIFVLILAPLLILMLPLTVYFVDSAAASDKVSRNVTIEGIDVSRMTQAETQATVDKYTNAILSNTVTVEVNGLRFPLEPADVDMTFNTDEAVATAMNHNKGGITDWFTAWTSETNITVEATLDYDLLDDKVREWELAAITNPAFEGSIQIVNDVAVVEPPENGEMIERAVSTSLIEAALISGAIDVIGLPTSTSTPSHTRAQLEAAADDANALIQRGVVLTNVEYEATFNVASADLAQSLTITVAADTIETTMDTDVFRPLVEAARHDLETDAISAYWETVVVDDFENWDENYRITDPRRVPGTSGLPNDDAIWLVAGSNGTLLDEDAIVLEVEQAAFSDGTGLLAMSLDKEPRLTTDEAKAYGDLYEVAEFTTYTPGTNRVKNIQLMADIVDEAIVMPGQTFSVNERVGQRTLEKGFLYDCAIVSGVVECEEDPVNVGGGVSQFGTTIFNTIYFGCYEDVTHQPHSIYFTKYPEGREATLGFPHPDVAFRNDSSAPVIIRTSYTGRSVTVTFFGNRDGGKCGTVRSDRSSVTEPTEIFRKDTEGIVAPGEEKRITRGTEGWNVTNTRIFYDADGNELKRQAFFWRYRGERIVILVHACDKRVGGNGNCVPTTTTPPTTEAPPPTEAPPTTEAPPPTEAPPTTDAPPDTTTTTAAEGGGDDG